MQYSYLHSRKLWIRMQPNAMVIFRISTCTDRVTGDCKEVNNAASFEDKFGCRAAAQ